MDIYTVLWGASYTHQRNQSVGAHYAVDIATAKGTPLYAIADGEVYSAEYNTAYGNVVKIKFKYKGEILYAVYAHMNKYNVKAGDTVRKGQQI
jgi:murein DD-endopeptidase MepM/ murein hydrolase activator NlpD